MGFDCTLHVVDEHLIRKHFVPKLLGRSQEDSAFDRRQNAAALWREARAFLSDSAVETATDATLERAANHVCQLAVTFCSAQLPYHYEREFCLSLWPEGELPRRFVGDPELLFEEIVSFHPKLKGKFPQELTGNGSTGIFVPVEFVHELLGWVQRFVRRSPKEERQMFRGLILVLKEAARRKLSYWEGSELPLSWEIIRPPEDQRRPGLEELKAPGGSWLSLVGNGGYTAVFDTGNSRIAFVDLSVWPAGFTVVNGHTVSAARSHSGRWVTATSEREKAPHYFRAVIKDNPKDEGTVLPAPGLRQLGIWWANWLGDRVVAVAPSESIRGPDGFNLGWPHELPAIPLIEHGHGLVPIETLPPATVRYPRWDVVRLNDGNDLFLWLGDGYELRNGRLELTFPLEPKASGPGVGWGTDGFYYIADGQLYSVRRG
jgi:hypothetical protein